MNEYRSFHTVFHFTAVVLIAYLLSRDFLRLRLCRPSHIRKEKRVSCVRRTVEILISCVMAGIPLLRLRIKRIRSNYKTLPILVFRSKKRKKIFLFLFFPFSLLITKFLRGEEGSKERKTRVLE